MSLTDKYHSKSLDAILGNSPTIMRMKSLISQVAGSDITILLTGESGTGKELAALAIHDLSPRRKNAIKTLNCGAIPEGLFESEIFGHEKGSFTSAEQRRLGYFEMADGGTLFLDEIGEMPLAVQVKILRALETGVFNRVGGSREIQVNVRIIAATNRDLGTEVEAGRFRRDLYYRLKAISVEMPPLRERRSDVPVLAQSFIQLFSIRNKRPALSFDHEALDILKEHYWAGNVRELKNFVESLGALSVERVLNGELVKARLRSDTTNPHLPVILSAPAEEADRDLIFRSLLEIRQELAIIKDMLRRQDRDRELEFINRSESIKRPVDYSFSEQREAPADIDEEGALLSELRSIKLALERQIQPHSQLREYPFSAAEEVETYALEEEALDKESGNEESQQEAGNIQRRHFSLDELELEQIRRTLHEFSGNRRLTARALRIGERTLYRKLKQYGLK